MSLATRDQEDKVAYSRKRKQVESSSNEEERTKAARFLTNNDSSSSLPDYVIKPVQQLVEDICYAILKLDLSHVLTLLCKEALYCKLSHTIKTVCYHIVRFLWTKYSPPLQCLPDPDQIFQTQEVGQTKANNDSSSSLPDFEIKPVQKMVQHISCALKSLLSDRDKLCQLLEQHPKLMQKLKLDLSHVLPSNVTIEDKEILSRELSDTIEGGVCSDIVGFLMNKFSPQLQPDRFQHLPDPKQLLQTQEDGQFDFGIQSMVADLESADSHTQLSLRFKELSKLFSGFISEIDDLESVDICLLLESIKQTTKTSGSQELKSEADVTLIHIISDYLSRYSLSPVFVLKHEVVQVLLDLLETDSVCGKVVEELRKVAFNGASRDNALNQGALATLLKKLETANVSMLRKLTLTISKLCGGMIEPPFSKVRPAIKALRKLLDETVDEEVLRNACDALSYLCGTADYSSGTHGWAFLEESQALDYASHSEFVDAFREANVLPVLVKLMRHSTISIIRPAIRTVLFICNDNDKKKICIHEGEKQDFFDCLSSLLEKELEEEMVCAIIATITCESIEWAKAVFEAGLIDRLRGLLEKKGIMGIAAVAIASAIDGIVDDQQESLAKCCIRPLCNYVDANDKLCVVPGLIGIDKILKLGEAKKANYRGKNVYAQQIKKFGKFEKLEKANASRVKEMEKLYWT